MGIRMMQWNFIRTFFFISYFYFLFIFLSIAHSLLVQRWVVKHKKIPPSQKKCKVFFFKWLLHSFSSKFWNFCLKEKRGRGLTISQSCVGFSCLPIKSLPKIKKNICCNVSDVRCHVLGVRCHVSGVKCQVSGVMVQV